MTNGSARWLALKERVALTTDDQPGNRLIAAPARLDAANNAGFTPFFAAQLGAVKQRQCLCPVTGNRGNKYWSQISFARIVGDLQLSHGGVT